MDGISMMPEKAVRDSNPPCHVPTADCLPVCWKGVGQNFELFVRNDPANGTNAAIKPSNHPPQDSSADMISAPLQVKTQVESQMCAACHPMPNAAICLRTLC